MTNNFKIIKESAKYAATLEKEFGKASNYYLMRILNLKK